MFDRKWTIHSVFFTRAPRRAVRRSERAPFRPHLESLEDRRVPANASSISGHVFIDPTGNGLVANATYSGESGVTVKLYQDRNHNGRLDGGDRLAGSATTAADGSYSFTGLAAGNYFVTELVPSGWVRTAPALVNNYAVNLAAGQTAAGNDFYNFQKPSTNTVSNISFRIFDSNGQYLTTVTDLRGRTAPGETVEADFTLAPGAAAVLSLATYSAPQRPWHANLASQQVPLATQTGTFGAGTASLTVTLPQNAYQVDFVWGAVLNPLGPAGSNISYSAQGRLLSADMGMRPPHPINPSPLPPPPPPPSASLSGLVFVDNAGTGVPVAGEGIIGVAVTLTGTDSSGNAVTMTTTTDANGNFTFTGLQAGTYTVTEAAPFLYLDESAASGSLGGSASPGSIAGIPVTAGASGTGYNFAEFAAT